MRDDLTILYYTAARIAKPFAKAIQDELVRAAGPDIPIVCVSHAFIGFGSPEFVIGPAEASIYQVYRNVLAAACAARTPYVACCEDDSLYTVEHFAWTPPRDDVFYYNVNRWVLTRRLAEDRRAREAVFYWRRRTQMAQLLCNRALLVDTLEERFEKYPTPVDHATAKRTGWGEPGRYERNLGLPPRSREYFETQLPNVTINHGVSLMGRRQLRPDDRVERDLPPWGDADRLWARTAALA